MEQIQSVLNGTRHNMTYVKVGARCKNIIVSKIEKVAKVIGKGYYNNLIIDCYMVYGENNEKLIEINEGPNLEIRFF